MKIVIQSVDADVNESVRTFIRERLQRLSEKHPWLIRAQVTLRKDNFDNARDKVIIVKIMIPGDDVFVERQEESWEKATQKVLEAVRRKLRKHKEKDFGPPSASELRELKENL